jgi:enoyl-CoA hydratase/carnithine racemase
MTSGRRYTAPAAEKAGIVEAVAAEHDVTASAIQRAAALAPNAGPTLGAIQAQMHHRTAAALREGPAQFPRHGHRPNVGSAERRAAR